METNLNPAPTRLTAGDMLRIANASGQSIAVVQGMVWVTQEGDQRDIFLSNGEDFVLNRLGTALVEAITDTSLLPLVSGVPELTENAAAIPMSRDRGPDGLRGVTARGDVFAENASMLGLARKQASALRAHPVEARLVSVAKTLLTDSSPRPCSGRINAPNRSSPMKAIVNALRKWLRLFDERYMFAQPDERQLRDVGLDRDFVPRESTKAFFWRT